MTRSSESICRPLSLYCWVAILFSCLAEAFCRCASNWSGPPVKEPYLRLVLVHPGLESLEGLQPERDYEAQDIVVVTDFSYFSLFCVLLQRRKEKSNISSLLGNPKVNSVTLGAFLLNLNSSLSLSHIFSWELCLIWKLPSADLVIRNKMALRHERIKWGL